MDAGLPAPSLPAELATAGVRLVELSRDDAVLAGALRGIAGGRGLLLGDRCCLALSLRAEHGVVLTADRAWTDLDLPLTVRLVR